MNWWIHIAISVVIFTVWIVKLIKSQDVICLGDILIVSLVSFTPIFNVAFVMLYMLKMYEKKLTKILDKPIWRKES